MFDDDTSYLDACARKIRAFGIQVFHPSTHSIMAIMKNTDAHTVGVIRKLHKIPFYQIYVYICEPGDLDYVGLEKQGKLITTLLSKPELFKDFQVADVSGHDNFEEQLEKILKDRI